jgi:hypothetical protein
MTTSSLPANTVPQANGIAVSTDDELLFMAGWLGVARVDARKSNYFEALTGAN